jgi:DNA (cytosine-5)-methyltransferase 1
VNEVIRTSTLKIGNHRGSPRIWIEGRHLEKAGFLPGMKITAEYRDSRIVVRLDENGDRVVSTSRKTSRPPIVDLNNAVIRQMFNSAEKVKVETRYGEIVITP